MADIEILCPHCGKHSSDPDFCSECGQPLAPSAPAAAAPAPAPSGRAAVATGPNGAELCPVCAEERKPHARFCDNCRYDFQLRKTFDVAPPPPLPPSVPVVAPATPAVQAGPATAGGPATGSSASAAPPDPAVFRHWDIVAVVDPALRGPDSPEAPVDAPERVFPLIEENLIGRRSQQQGIFPAIALEGDLGVSRRHAVITRSADGTVSLLDHSTNGTRLNGHTVQPNVVTPLKDGDSITLGNWSRLTLRAR